MRALTFFRRHIELVLILPAIVAGAYLVWRETHEQGRPALEFVAIASDYIVALLPVALLGYLAWRFTDEYLYDPPRDVEEKWHETAASTPWTAVALIAVTRGFYLALFGLLLYAFSSFAGAATPASDPATQCTRDLLVRWEITSEQAYVRRYQSPIWPGGASGITWGVGYDGGHQSAPTILREWGAHAAAPRLATTSGITGEPARAALPRYRDIVVPWAMAVDVLEASSIPRYRAAARRAYGRHFDAAPPGVQCALTSETYNRGEAMAGSRRAERREIRDVCLPAGDAECTARQLEASCRVWAADTQNGPGLCARRRDEARAARAGA